MKTIVEPYHGDRPPILKSGALNWMKNNLFSPWYNAVLTVVTAALVYILVTPLWRWAVTDACFGTTPDVCKGSHGACWAFIQDMWPVFMVGTYPSDQRWRVALAAGMVLLLIIATLFRALRKKRLLHLLWILSPAVIFILVRGGETFHLQYVPSTQWGGLMLTVFLSLVSMIFAFPLSVLLALGRQSDMPVIRSVSVAYIELVRGVPLISILFMASVVLPLFFPPEMEFSKIMRAMVGITLFFAAYLAENIRGGLQGLARGQYEAADALGLGYWKKMGFIILPQALRIVLPPMVNNFIGILKDTSLVGIIGLIDLLQVAFAATSNPKWLGKIEEAYLFVALFYWIMCYSLSKFSRILEERYQL